MAPKRCNVKLQPGDKVSAAAYSWGRPFARSMGDKGGRNAEIRVEGTVIKLTACGKKWEVQFDEEEPIIGWARSELRFVSRPGVANVQGSRPSAPLDAADDHDSSEDEPEEPADAASDSSDLEEEDVPRAGRPQHAMASEDLGGTGEWIQDNHFASDERAKNGYTEHSPPSVSNFTDGDWRGASLLQWAKHLLPMNYLALMAAEMTAVGRQKASDGQSKYAGWVVSTEDLLQWIGVWIYMLAFPQQASTRRSFFQPPLGGYGPAHNLQAVLLQAGKGSRGLSWFEQMLACFTLPRWNNRSETQMENGIAVVRSEPFYREDPFAPTRRFWDSLRTAFYSSMNASWLLCLDESMIRWTGRGMPGLMVILRKPTPIGLELHTLCCALCGVLTWFEVYEGKDAMAKKPFNDKYPKSIALSLRMLEPYFGTARAAQ